VLAVSSVSSQKVTVSNEINIRSSNAYDILPNVGENILFYHDRGNEQVLEIYDQNLRYKRTKQLFFEQKNFQILALIPRKDDIVMVYSFKDEGISYILANRYDSYGEILHSDTLVNEKSKILSTRHRFIHSDDKSKTLLFAPMDGGLNMLLMNNDSLSLNYGFTLIYKEFNFKEDFRKITLSDNGEVYILGKKEDSFNKNNKDRAMILKVIDAERISLHYLLCQDLMMHNLLLNYDNINESVVVAGLVSKSDENTSVGYFAAILNAKYPEIEFNITPNLFSLDFLAEFYGKKPGKVKELSGFYCRDMILRRDGGLLLITELQKQYTRRAPMSNANRFGEFVSVRGFVDYYHEDLLILSMNKSGAEEWKKILFKKQFSQDDDGVFSSCFVFKTPSRIRLVYNDEIKTHNTVSEYVLDPAGNYERNSVLSTEYQNLKLRFRDAVQISPVSFIVPSEKNYKINMVRIDYFNGLN
jgi:hypothetical protein